MIWADVRNKREKKFLSWGATSNKNGLYLFPVFSSTQIMVQYKLFALYTFVPAFVWTA